MGENGTDKFAAGEQGLGYIYQPRFALLQLLRMPESTSVFIEKDDDLDFLDGDGIQSLASLKHKATGDRLTDLATDFWKSVRIWLLRYKKNGRSESNLKFILFTTGIVSDNSFLTYFLPLEGKTESESVVLSELADNALGHT